MDQLWDVAVAWVAVHSSSREIVCEFISKIETKSIYYVHKIEMVLNLITCPEIYIT